MQTFTITRTQVHSMDYEAESLEQLERILSGTSEDPMDVAQLEDIQDALEDNYESCNTEAEHYANNNKTQS